MKSPARLFAHHFAYGFFSRLAISLAANSTSSSMSKVVRMVES
jgi:hypothetical protein